MSKLNEEDEIENLNYYLNFPRNWPEGTESGWVLLNELRNIRLVDYMPADQFLSLMAEIKKALALVPKECPLSVVCSY